MRKDQSDRGHPLQNYSYRSRAYIGPHGDLCLLHVLSICAKLAWSFRRASRRCRPRRMIHNLEIPLSIPYQKVALARASTAQHRPSLGDDPELLAVWTSKKPCPFEGPDYEGTFKSTNQCVMVMSIHLCSIFENWDH